MNRLLCAFSLLAVCLLSAVPAEAAERLFVFHGDEAYASVYDVGALNRVETVAVEPGAFAALGVPASSGGGFEKFYVVSQAAVVILDGSLAVRGRLPFPAPIQQGPNTVALSASASRLLVISGQKVYIVDTETDSIVAELEPGFPPSGVVVRPGPGSAFLTSATSNSLVRIDLLEDRLVDGIAEMPAPLTALASAPDGSKVYGASDGALFDLERIPSSFFRTEPGEAGPSPMPLNVRMPIDKLLLSDTDRFLVRAGGVMLQGELSARDAVQELADQDAVDLVITPDGRSVIVATADVPRVTQFNPDGSGNAESVDLRSAPTGLALVSAAAPRLKQSKVPSQAEASPNEADQLLKISGDGQTPNQNSSFTFVVEARLDGLPQASAVLTITSAPTAPVISCPSTIPTGSDGRAQITCGTGSVMENTAGLIQVREGENVVLISVTVLASGSSGSGLSIVSGNNQFVVQNSGFPQPLIVRATDGGVPQAGLTLMSTPDDPSVFCSPLVITDANGEGQIFCGAGSVTSRKEVDIDVEDSLGRTIPEPFVVTITPELIEADSLELVSDPLVEGAVGETVFNAITVRALDEEEDDVEGVAVYFSSSDDVTFFPEVAVTNSDGDATTSVAFGCPFSQGSLFAGLKPAGRDIEIAFAAASGAPTVLSKTQGDNQSGSPGELLDQTALLVQLTDICGNPAAGEPVAWNVNPPQAAELVNFINITDFRGRSGGVVRLGNFGGPFTITALANGLTATFNLRVINVPTSLVALGGSGQTVMLGATAPLPLLVEARADDGLGVGGVDVAYRVVGGVGMVAPESATTDSRGRASTMVTAGNALGPITVEASAFGLTVRFTINTSGRVPEVTVLNFVNGGSFVTGWVPGGTGTIFGSGLMEGIDGVELTQGAPFPTQFRGVSVTLNGTPLPILGLANVNGVEQINVQVDFQALPGSATVVLNNNGSTTTVNGVQILNVQPGIFEVGIEGGRFAAALHADFSLVTPSNPARPGEIILLFLTGLGATNPPVGTNVPGPTPPAMALTQPVVGIDSTGMDVVGTFYAPGLLTVYQINFRVGPGVQSGNRTLSVVADGIPSQAVLFPILR